MLEHLHSLLKADLKEWGCETFILLFLYKLFKILRWGKKLIIEEFKPIHGEDEIKELLLIFFLLFLNFGVINVQLHDQHYGY